MKTLTSLSAAALCLGVCAPAFAADHPHGIDFVHNAIEGDNSEMTLGAIAARRGSTPAVRSYGQMLVKDHTEGKRKAVALARKLHTYAPKSMIGMAITEEPKLQRLSGRAFDREFTSYMVKDHKEDVADFQAEAQSNDNPAIIAFAKETLPVLEKHLSVAKTLGGTG